MAHPINDLMNATLEKVRGMMDANTVVGKPIEAGGVIVIPISKISIGYASGGSDFAQKNQKQEKDNAFGGGAGMGVTITPVSFLVIREGTVRVVGVEHAPETTVDRVIELVPQMVDKVEDIIQKKKEEKAEKAEIEE